MRSRAEEIFHEELRIRQNAIAEGRRLSAYERKWLRKLAVEAAELREQEPTPAPAVAKPPHHGPTPIDPERLPASMRPGAGDNE